MPCLKRNSLLLALACWALFLGTVTSSGARPVRLLKNFGDDAIGALSSEEIVSFDSSDPAEESLSLSSAERRYRGDDRPWFFQETSSQPFLIAFSIGTAIWGIMAIAMVYGEHNQKEWASAGDPEEPDLYSCARVFVGLSFVFFDFVVMCSKFNWYLTNDYEEFEEEGSCNFLGIDYFQPALNVKGKSFEQIAVQISMGIGLIIYFLLMIGALGFEELVRMSMKQKPEGEIGENPCLTTLASWVGRLLSGFFCFVILCQQYLVLMPLNEVTMESEDSTELSLDVPTDKTHALCLYAYAVQALPLAILFAGGAGVGFGAYHSATSDENAETAQKVFGIVCGAAGVVCACYCLAFIVYWIFGGFAVGIWFFFASMKWNFKTGRVVAILLGPNIADGLMQVVGFLARGCKGKPDWKSNNNSSSAGGQDGQGDHGEKVVQHLHDVLPDDKDPQKNGKSGGQRPSSMPHAPSIPDPQPTRPTTISNFPPQYNVQASLAYGQQSPEGSVEYRPPGPPGPQASQGSCNCPECQRAMGSATTVHIHYHRDGPTCDCSMCKPQGQGAKPASAMHGGPLGPPGSCNCPQCQQAGGYSYPGFGGFGGYGGPMPGYGGPMPGYGGPPGFRFGY